jgi:hypothetical protein
MTKNPSYVCSTCGQDFTRKSNAKRHNQNIHSDKAEIVRFLEYLIGRISGKYLPGDPLSYRPKNRNKNNATFVHANDNNLCREKSDSSKIKNTDFSSSMGGVKPITNHLDYLIHLNNLIQLNDRKSQERLQRRKIEEKLEEIKRMLYDLNSPETAQIPFRELTNKYNATTDYVSFIKELENYRRSLVNDGYLKWR